MTELERKAIVLDDYIPLPGPEGIIVLLPLETFLKKPQPEMGPPRPTPRQRTADEKDEFFREMLTRVAPLLASHSPLYDLTKPYSALLADCRELAASPNVAAAVGAYLHARPAVCEAADMLVTAISMSANAKWRRVPEGVRPVAARGWFLNRWLPTFLIVDGPIMRFMNNGALWKGQSRRPTAFNAARALLGDKIFVAVRNAFAHWSFGWETINREHWILVYDQTSGVERIRFHQRQGDALHMIAWSVVEVLSEVFLRRRG